MIVEALIYLVVGAFVTGFIRRYFKRKDSETFAKQTATAPVLVIRSFSVANHKFINAWQNAVVISIYGVLLWSVLAIGVTAFGLVPARSGGTLLVEVIMGVVTLFSIFMVLFTFMILVAQSRHRTPIPNFLVSKNYSLVDVLYVDVNGFDGQFSLSWQRVYSCVPLDDTRLKLSYHRSPRSLTKLIGADTLILEFDNPLELQQVIDIYTQVTQMN